MTPLEQKSVLWWTNFGNQTYNWSLGPGVTSMISLESEIFTIDVVCQNSLNTIKKS